ncbi:lipopolysaccharide biosynthesis protein [Pseudopedobacter beijingensis]|uniref:Lipopolysaccharide biosynthesis protein n=1 Tax=Pseudopedobacter beijingensis TaxID=1207056 RepID=A0ABW4I8F1_9SPHI
MKILNKFNFKSKNLILVLVSVLTQVLPILISPIFSRIYSPEQFGEFSILLSYSSIFVIFFSGKYELALLLPKHEIDIKRVFQLCLAVISSSFLFTTVLCIVYYVLSKIFNLKFDPVYLITPLYASLIAIYQLSCYLLLYLKLFRELSLNRFIKSFVTIIVIACLGWFFKGVNGLIIGSFIGQFLSIVLCFDLLNKKSLRFRHLQIIRGFAKFKSIMVEYINFPKYSLPADLINAVVSQAPVFILSIYFSKTIVGYYGFVVTVVQVPISIIASAVLDIFKEMSTREFKEKGNCKNSFKKTFLLLLGINIIPLTVILGWGPLVFEFVFGTKWSIAGSYAQVMVIMFFIKFISSPLSYTFILMGRQKLDLYLHLLILILLILSLFAGIYFNLSAFNFLVLIASVFGFIYLIYLVKSYEFSKGYGEKIS